MVSLGENVTNMSNDEPTKVYRKMDEEKEADFKSINELAFLKQSLSHS